MDSMRPELIVGAILLLAGVVVLRLAKEWIIRNFGKDGYENMSIFASSGASKRSAPDPLAAAEVYIAYGEKKEALKILVNALHEHPARTDIASKIDELESKR